jgi:hypothetical protein
VGGPAIRLRTLVRVAGVAVQGDQRMRGMVWLMWEGLRLSVEFTPIETLRRGF